MRRELRTLICDLDNTLYDWVSFFVPAIYAMIDVAVGILACDREELLDDLRLVHQAHHDSEHPYALIETETVKRVFKDLSLKETLDALDPAFYAFNAARKKLLRLHPHVRDTLDVLRGNDIRLVAHTESNLFAVVDRLRRLGLSDYFQRIYCRERAQTIKTNSYETNDWFQGFPLERVVELSRHQRKPDVKVLLEICEDEQTKPEDTAYIGDSMARDILMARQAGVFAIWAEYGASHDEALYSKLVRITHWSADDVEREKRLKIEASKVRPDLVCHENFGEVLVTFAISRLGMHQVAN